MEIKNIMNSLELEVSFLLYYLIWKLQLNTTGFNKVWSYYLYRFVKKSQQK